MLGAASIWVVLAFLSLQLNAASAITVVLPSPDPQPMTDCDYGPIIVKVGIDRTIIVNGKIVKEGDLQRHLGQILQTRVARLIYFAADSRLQFKSVISVLERCNSVPNLTIALVTRSVARSQCWVLPVRNKP